MTDNSQGSKRRLVAVLGSPRRRGNSDTLALQFLKGAESRGWQHSIIVPTDLGLSPCDGQNLCFRDGRCTIHDGMNDIYDVILRAPILLVATPVYFMGPPGSLKSFIDRFQAVWARSAILGEFDPDSPERRSHHKSYAILVGATTESMNMYKPTRSILKAFSNVIGFEYSGDLVAPGLDKPGDAAEMDALLKKAYQAGAALAESCTPR